MSVSRNSCLEPWRGGGKVDRKLTATQPRALGERRTDGARRRRRFPAQESGASARKKGNDGSDGNDGNDGNNVLFLTGGSKQPE